MSFADQASGMLTLMQDQLEQMLTGSATRSRYTLASDGMGGQSVSSTAVLALDCFLEPVGGDETVIGDRIMAVGEFILHVPAGSDIVPSDRVTVGSVDYEIVCVDVITSEPIKRCGLRRLAAI